MRFRQPRKRPRFGSHSRPDLIQRPRQEDPGAGRDKTTFFRRNIAFATIDKSGSYFRVPLVSLSAFSITQSAKELLELLFLFLSFEKKKSGRESNHGPWTRQSSTLSTKLPRIDA